MDQGDRQMFNVDIACADCGTAITQLPFEPKGDKPVYCTDCLRQKRQSRGGMGNGPRRFNNNNRGPRQMFDVNEKCADCGTAITQLPFQPTGGRPIYCFDCVKSKRDSR